MRVNFSPACFKNMPNLSCLCPQPNKFTIPKVFFTGVHIKHIDIYKSRQTFKKYFDLR